MTTVNFRWSINTEMTAAIKLLIWLSATIGSLAMAQPLGSGRDLYLTAGGTVVGWGWNYDGQCTPPAGLTGVTAMAAGRHRTRAGFEEPVEMAFSTNGDGVYRRWRIEDVIGSRNPQRLYAEQPRGIRG